MTDRDRLVELIKPFASGSACEQESGVCEFKDCKTCNAECIATNLLANGVIVPPVNINDVIYTIVKNTVVAHRVEKIEVHLGGLISFCFSWHGMGYEHKFTKDIGKTVFLTKEEAEKALKERENSAD